MVDRNAKTVKKILTNINKILDYCDGVSEKEFMGDMKLVDACALNLIQIGELAKAIDSDFEETHSEIAWHQIRGLRNKIVHDYEGLNLIRIWAVVSEDLPDLKQRLKNNEFFRDGHR